MNATAQDIEVGPVRVDTGNDYLDLGFVIVLLCVLLLAYVIKKRVDRSP